MYHAMKQFCELTKPVSNKQPLMINAKSQQICNNNETNIDESKRSEKLRLSKISCLPQDNKSLKIENMSTSCQHDLTLYKANFNTIKVNLVLIFK